MTKVPTAVNLAILIDSIEKSGWERSNSTVLVSQWYLLTALSSHLADPEIVTIKKFKPSVPTLRKESKRESR